MLREIELSLMLASSVTVDKPREKVTILLPASKTDPEALSCTRSWGCVPPAEPDPLACPFHAAVAQQELLEKTFGKEKLRSAGFPFAPTRAGGAASKEQVVHNVQQVAQARGLQLKNHLGKDNFTGKVLRIGGARHLIRKAVSIPVVQMMARWDSHAILTYVKDAPLITITHEYRKGAMVAVAAGEDEAGRKFKDKVTADLRTLQKEVKRQENEIEMLAKDVYATTITEYPKFIISDKYQKWHIIHDYRQQCRADWKTSCGWAYGHSIFERKAKIHAKVDIKKVGCDRCFKFTKPDEDPNTDVD